MIDVRGQHVSAMDRLYLLGELPTLIVWGERDNTIPIAHGLAAHELIPNSRFVTLPTAAHFPHLEDPDGLADALLDWLDDDRARADRGRGVGRDRRRPLAPRGAQRRSQAPRTPIQARPSPSPPSGSRG